MEKEKNIQVEKFEDEDIETKYYNTVCENIGNSLMNIDDKDNFIKIPFIKRLNLVSKALKNFSISLKEVALEQKINNGTTKNK
ncbi:MAG: hypothetical protein M1501_00955 [Candidatus Omnitrophica bacterium]|nr:hypothetical protein [Candidatus Omnitrophota bacterium]